MVRPRAAPLSSISRTSALAMTLPQFHPGRQHQYGELPADAAFQPYALIAEPNPSTGTVPFGLPYTYDSTASSRPADPTLGDFLQEGVIPAGFEVLQLLDHDGSTAVELSSNLDIFDAPTNFAINMQDVSDPDFTTSRLPGWSRQEPCHVCLGWMLSGGPDPETMATVLPRFGRHW